MNATAGAASAAAAALPPLPEYTLTPLAPLIPPIPDKFMALLMPIAAYWIVSMFFHWIDVNDYWARYRLHTPVEILKRNHVTRFDVARDVIIQQVIQTVVGALASATEPDAFVGKEIYDIAVWARRVRVAQRALPPLLALVGVDANGLAKSLGAHHYPALAGAVAGGIYDTVGDVPAFAPWEMTAARLLYWVLVPALQYIVAIIVMDTWQYFLHRAMHMNKWLYTTFHSRHHRLYVPYAFGALYNHPFEGFLLDSLGGAISYKVAGMDTRQSMWFFTCSTIKTVDDHCGYALPWDPLQLVTSNNAGYHDVHHQSWGVKTNFSQPFFTFWDRLLGTMWTGGDVSARYERAARAAQAKLDAEIHAAASASITGSDPATTSQDPGPYADADPASIPDALKQPPVPAGKAELQATASREQVLDGNDDGELILVEEVREEEEERIAAAAAAAAAATSSSPRKGNRRRTASSLNSDSLRGLRERVSIHGRTGGIIGVDHAH